MMWKNYALIDAKEFVGLIEKTLMKRGVKYTKSVDNNGSNFYNDGLDFYSISFEKQDIKIIPVQGDPLSRFTRKFLFNSSYSDLVTFISLKNHKCDVSKDILNEIYQNNSYISNITQSERFRFAFTLKFFNKLRWERLS